LLKNKKKREEKSLFTQRERERERERGTSAGPKASRPKSSLAAARVRPRGAPGPCGPTDLPDVMCHGLLFLGCFFWFCWAAAADCDGEESQKKITPSLRGSRGWRGEDAKPAPAPAIKLEELPLLTRWDSLAIAAAMLCITSPSSSPAPLQPARRSRALSDRAAPPRIAVRSWGYSIYCFCFSTDGSFSQGGGNVRLSVLSVQREARRPGPAKVNLLPRLEFLIAYLLRP
jgi:hypothetical protein